MMNGMAIGPMLVLALILGGLFLLVLSASRKGRRRGRIVAAAVLMLLMVLGTSLFLTRVSTTRARAERDYAEAMRQQAIAEEIRLRNMMAGLDGGHPGLPQAAQFDTDASGSEDPEEDSTFESETETAESMAEKLNNTLDVQVDEINSTTGTTVNGVRKTTRVELVSPVPPVPPAAPRNKKPRIEFPYRTTRDQVITAIMLAGVVLAGYFFLNANTRGHFTWPLRIGSTVVFIASLTVILIITHGH